MVKRKIGIVGYGHLGKYLVDEILKSETLELAFVWNRTKSVLDGQVEQKYILSDLKDFENRQADLVVEVAHPSVTKEFGASFLETADYMIGSPTALADKETEDTMKKAADKHGLYVPRGALWGGEDIQRMANSGKLQALKVTMKKPPESFKLEEPLKSKNAEVKDTPMVLYDGPVRELCSLAPNNVNTMAAAAIAGHNLGFEKTQGSIIADPSLTDWHVVEVELWGPGNIQNDTAFHCKTVRRNPAKVGHVTGSATYTSFLASVLSAQGKGPGVHLC